MLQFIQANHHHLLRTLTRTDIERFWATGRLALKGENPFSTEQIDQLYQEQGIPLSEEKLVVLYPPWLLPLFALLGILDLNQSHFLWMLIQVGIVLICADKIWGVYQGPREYLWVAWLLSIFFAPTIFVIGWGHFSPIILIGLIGFLKHLPKQDKNYKADGIAGAWLVLTTIKPHVCYLFLIALLLWILQNKRWGVVAGMLSAIFGLLILTIMLDPLVITHYLSAKQSVSQLAWETPTFGFLLRSWLGIDHIYLQFIPMLFGIAWLLYQWRSFRYNWDWKDQMPTLILVSVSSAPFVWTYDMVVIILSSLVASIMLLTMNNLIILMLGFGFYAVLNIANLLLHRFYSDGWFFWFAPLILVWFLIIQRYKKLSCPQIP